MTTTAMGTQLRSGAWDVVPRGTSAAFTVRNWGLIQVHGTFSVTAGEVAIVDGEPVGATATLDAGSVSTGIKKRDIDLYGRRFLAAAEHPEIRVTVREVRPTDGAWEATATLAVAGERVPLELTVRREPDPDDGTIRVVATGVLDRRHTSIRAPRFLVGRWIAVEVHATLRRRP